MTASRQRRTMTQSRLCILSVRTLLVSASSGTFIDTVTSDQWVKDHPRVILIGGVTIVTAALVPILLPVILNGAGFTAGGVAAGSWAAGVHASIGNVAAGSLFAIAQSIGAGGALPLSVWLASAGLGLSAGAIAEIIRRLMARLMESGILHHMKIIAHGFREHQAVLAGTMGTLLKKDMIGDGPGPGIFRFFANLPRPGGRVRSD
jgi:hypothetical protein